MPVSDHVSDRTLAAGVAGLGGLAVGYFISRRVNKIQGHLSADTCAAVAPIANGDCLTAVKLFENLPANAVVLPEVIGKGKAIVFGLPGAFTPG
jgi:hypothetical protein